MRNAGKRRTAAGDPSARVLRDPGARLSTTHQPRGEAAAAGGSEKRGGGASRGPGRGSRSPALLRERRRPLPPRGAGVGGVRPPSRYAHSLTYVCAARNGTVSPGIDREGEGEGRYGTCRCGFRLPSAAESALRNLIYSSVRLASGPVSGATPRSLLLLEQVFLGGKKEKTGLKTHVIWQPFLFK